MNIELVIIIVALVAAAALLIWEHRRTSKTNATVAGVVSKVERVGATVEGAVTRLAAVPSLVATHIETALKAKARPIVATTSEPAPAAAPDPAAPAPVAAVAPPPTTPAPVSPTDGSGTEYPQVIAVDGVHMQVSAPLNPAFKLDPMTKAYDSPTSYLFDPSNGGKCNPPQPTRSPAGFPLFYAIGANNAPVGEARVLYNGQTFADDAAVAAYITAVATAHAADDVAAAAAAAQVFAGPVPVSALTHADLQFLWWATINPSTPKLHNWEFQVLSGSRHEIQLAMSTIGNNVAQMNGYDAAKYAGVLRSYYDAAVKA